MRILFLIPEYSGSGGGIGTFYRALLPVLRDSGLEIAVLEGSAFHFSEDGAKQAIDGIPVQVLEQKRFISCWKRLNAFEPAPSLRRHLAAAWALWEQADFGAGSDIIEATDWPFLFLPPAIEHTRPLVVQCHGSLGQIADHDPIETDIMDNVLARLIERSVLTAVPAVQTYSSANASFWQAETGRAISLIRPSWTPNNKGAGGKQPNNRGLVVGRLQRWKGPAVLCEALQRLGAREFTVDWVGRDTAWGAHGVSTARHLAQMFPDVWGGRLQHLAPAPPAEIAQKQANALCNIIPSTWDMFNFTVVEAMASGRPTIVSNGAGASELVENGVNGYVFNSGDADGLASTIDRVLGETPSRLAQIGREANRTIQIALQPQTIADQRIDAYRATISKFNPSSPALVDGWLRSICRPNQMTGAEMRFLENVPLRALIKHIAGRLYRRLT